MASIASQALEDIENGHYDRSLAKGRMRMEETFCYVMELWGKSLPEAEILENPIIKENNDILCIGIKRLNNG